MKNKFKIGLNDKNDLYIMYFVLKKSGYRFETESKQGYTEGRKEPVCVENFLNLEITEEAERWLEEHKKWENGTRKEKEKQEIDKEKEYEERERLQPKWLKEQDTIYFVTPLNLKGYIDFYFAGLNEDKIIVARAVKEGVIFKNEEDAIIEAKKRGWYHEG